MTFRVSGKHIELGEALRERISARVLEALEKYFDGGFSGHATVDKEAFGFHTECVVHLDSGIEMHHAFGVEAERLLVDGGMAGKSAVEILLERFEDAGADALTQGFAELDVFAGYAKGHGWPPVAVPNQTPRANPPPIQLGSIH